MTSSSRSSTLIKEFLSVMDPNAPDGAKGREMMEKKLQLYLWWKGRIDKHEQDRKTQSTLPKNTSEARHGEEVGLSAALKHKDKLKADRSASRRRVRGGAPATAAVESNRTIANAAQEEVVFGEGAVGTDRDASADL